MEIAEKQKIQIIALQETKLNEKYNLKYKNYNILRKDRNKEGGGLVFLIKNLYYEDIAINIPNTSDLEAQGIKVYLNQNKTINIFNMYHPPNNKLIDDGTMAQFLTGNTIIQNTNEDFGKAPIRIKDLERNWISFKKTIIKAAKVSIPRGNSYQISSKIKFEIKDKKVEKKARKIIHDCKKVTSTHYIFHEKIKMKELDYALENTDLNKTPGPDGIHGQMISNLGKNCKERLLEIFNNSWKTGKLPKYWETATIIPIKKLDKSADDPKKLPTYFPHKYLLQINRKNYAQTTHLPPRHKKSLTIRTLWIQERTWDNRPTLIFHTKVAHESIKRVLDMKIIYEMVKRRLNMEQIHELPNADELGIII
ncbi:hypothetical protein LAZ67_16001919 [Cordylochernes scorpioides]|uniref:Reverse transcriptase domain-containing protein n=1 Tax=Cordylochernes scorpioides TaxID=51811 RepID=A0ABY6LDN0_9ARAC|nr:hypothetical protein LAZ67_16001919 [Cordylochernes scorpioides]